MSLKVGYWATNEYHRLNVKDFVEEFCGWNPLLDLMNHADSQRNKAFLTALFQTGGRTSEVLALQKQNLIGIQHRNRNTRIKHRKIQQNRYFHCLPMSYDDESVFIF